MVPPPPSPVDKEDEPPRGAARVAEAVRERVRGLVPYIPESARRALRWDATAGAIGGIYLGSIFPFIGVIARDRLHASTFQLALYSSSTAVGNLFNPVVAHHIRNRAKLAYYVWPYLIGRAVLFLMPLAVHAPLFIALAFIANAIASLASPAYAAIIRDAYPAARRGRCMGLVRVVAVLATMVGSAVGGNLLAHHSYRLLFPLLSIIGLAATLAFAQIGVQAQPEEDAPPAMRLRDMLRLGRTDPSFRLYCTCFYLYGFGNLVTAPVVPVVQVDLLKITPQWVGYLSAAGAASSVLGYLYWGRVVDRHGPFRLMLRVVSVVAIAPITYFLVFWSPHVEWLLIPACAQGFGWAGGDLGYVNAAMRFGKRENAAAYAGVFSFLQAMRGIPGPFLGALLANTIGPRWVFLVGLGFWLASASVLLRTGALQIETEVE